jgi:hypothetical protein
MTIWRWRRRSCSETDPQRAKKNIRMVGQKKIDWFMISLRLMMNYQVQRSYLATKTAMVCRGVKFFVTLYIWFYIINSISRYIYADGNLFLLMLWSHFYGIKHREINVQQSHPVPSSPAFMIWYIWIGDQFLAFWLLLIHVSSADWANYCVFSVIIHESTITHLRFTK